MGTELLQVDPVLEIVSKIKVAITDAKAAIVQVGQGVSELRAIYLSADTEHNFEAFCFKHFQGEPSFRTLLRYESAFELMQREEISGTDNITASALYALSSPDTSQTVIETVKKTLSEGKPVDSKLIATLLIEAEDKLQTQASTIADMSVSVQEKSKENESLKASINRMASFSHQQDKQAVQTVQAMEKQKELIVALEAKLRDVQHETSVVNRGNILTIKPGKPKLVTESLPIVISDMRQLIAKATEVRKQMTILQLSMVQTKDQEVAESAIHEGLSSVKAELESIVFEINAITDAQ